MEKPEVPYLITIKFEDEIILKVIQTAERWGLEEELIAFFYQQYCDEQPDITQYHCINLEKEPGPELKLYLYVKEMTLQSRLADLAVEYSGKYDFIGN